MTRFRLTQTFATRRACGRVRDAMLGLGSAALTALAVSSILLNLCGAR